MTTGSIAGPGSSLGTVADDAEMLGPESFIRDGDWSLISHDPYTGRQVWVHEDEQFVHVKTTYPLIGELIDHNTAIRNETAGRRWGEGKLVASIPEHIYYREIAPARRDGDEGYVKRWLNDAEHRAFRTFEGKV